MSSHYFIGTSGWHYDHWRDRFYPKNLTKKLWLEYYSRHFTTVELNYSFYRLPSETAFNTWYDSSPDNFTFAVKVSRFITHNKRLKNCVGAVGKYITRVNILREKLGPLLYQLPPNLHRNDEVLESFLLTLPQGMRHVFEFRHKSWIEEKVFEILHKYNVGLCIVDMPLVPFPLIVTADFAYVRFHGSSELYSSCYSNQELVNWAKRLAILATNLKVIYIYFNNDAKSFAVRNALTLRNYLETGNKL